jgi:PAS domain S-box-containing protein
MENQVPCILIVDDDPNLIGSISDILSAKGFEAIAALTGASALASIKQHHIDVALIDLRLEDMSGLDVLKRIKENSPEIECIFLTGHASQSSAIEAIQMGAFGFFQKPFDVDQLLLFIQRAIEKHAAVEALRKSEERYHRFFEDTPIAIWQEDFSELKRHLDELKKQGVTDFREYFASHADALLEYSQMIKIVDVNSAALQLYGAENKEALIKSTDEILSKGEQEHILEVFVAVAEGKTSDSWEDLDETMSGETIEINLSWSVAPGSEDDYSKVMVTTQDITERRKAEKALRQSEARFHALIQNAADLILVIDPDGVIQYASPSSERILGYTDQEFVGKKFNEWVHPEDLPLAVEALNRRRKIAGTSANSIAVRCMHKNGTWRVIEVLGTNLLAEPSIMGIVMNIRDITDRKLAESALSENEERYRLLFENAPVGIFSANSQGQIIEINPVAMQILGSPSVEATKAINLLTFPLLVETGFSAKFTQCFETGRPVYAEQSYTSKWGKLIYAQYRMTPIKDASGQITLVQVILEDITERKLNEEKVHKLAFMLDMAPNSITVHDFDGKALMANERAIEMHGFTREEFMALNLHQLDAPDSEPLISSRMQLLRERGEAIFEVGHHRKDGSILPLEVSARVANWGDQQAILSIGTDITVRRQTEDQLRLQSSALNAAANAIVITDVNGAVQWANPAFTLLTGYTLEESLNKNPRELVRSGQQGQAYYQNMWNTILSGDVWHGEIVNRRKDGSHYSEELTITPLKDAEGQVIHFIAVKQDITERKQAEAALSVREKQYRTLVEQLPAIVYIDDINIEGRTMYISPQIETILGFTPQEWQEKSPGLWSQQVHPDDLEWVHAEYMRCFQDGEPLDYEYRIRASDGRLLWFRDQAILLRDENGKPYLIQGVIYDITERKQAEEILRDRERSLRESQMIAGLGSYVFDIQRGMWTSSEVLDQILGIDENYVHSLDGWEALIHPDFRQEMSDYLAQEILGNHARFDREYKVVRENDGVEIWVHGLGELELDAQNRPVKLQGTIQDITERKQADAALHDREEQYRTLVEQVPAIVYIDDATAEPGQTIYISPQIENILGYTPEEWRQGDLVSWIARLHPDDAQHTLDEFLRCFKGGEPIDSEYRMIAADGRCLWIRDQAVRLNDEDGKPRFIHGIMSDITQRKWADEAIHQRVMELELLYESGLAFIQLLHPKEIAQKIINLLEQKMNWHHTAIRLFDPETETIQLLAFNQPNLTSAEEIAAVEDRLKTSIARPGQGLSGWVIQHGEAVRSDDLAGDERYIESVPGMKSGLYVPIKLSDHVIGVISIESDKPDAFSVADERLVNTLVNQAASALENARLFDETRQRIMELTALHSTGQTLLASRLDPQQIYAEVHKAVLQTMPCDAFVIVLDDEERGDYHAVYFLDKGVRYPERRLPRGKGLSGRVISSGETLFIHDVVETPQVDATHFGSMELSRSILAVPLHRGDAIIGMLSTQSYKPHVFGENQRVMLETIAAQLSSALDSTNLYQQTRARINELETLHTISTSLRTIQTIDKTLSTLLDNTLSTLETTAGQIMLHDPLRNELRDVVSRGWFASMNNMPIKVGEGVAGKVFASGELYTSDEFIRDSLPHASTRNGIPAGWGGVCLPIRTSTEVIGVLFVSVQLPRQISSQQISLLESLVDMAGSAVHRMRLHSETARRAEEFESLYDMSKTLSAEYDLNSLLGVIVKGVKVMMNTSTSGMYLYHADSQELELTMDTEPSIQLGIRLQMGEGVAGKVAMTRQPMRIDDYSTWEGRSAQFDNFPVHAVIEVPMLYAGELIGVLTADETGDSGRKFTDADERLLSLFASQAAGAINSARHRAYIIRYAEELEQRVAERTAEIETTRQRLDLAAGAAGIGVWEINLKDLKVFWDPRMHDIHGTDPATFDNLLTTWWQMIYSDDIADSQKRFQDALQESGVFSDQHRIIRADGALRHISASGIVLYDEENVPERLIGVNMDVTEQKIAEGTLQRANLEMERAMRTKDEFLANMSHELRTPLNSILGISESLEEQIVGNLNEKQLRYIGIVKESGRHLLELINDILDISKIEAGRMELDLHNVSVEKLCQSSLRMIKELAQKKNLKVAFEVIGPVDVVLGDERRLKQSLVNLLSNAVKFTPADSHIGLEVCGHPEENEVTFTVWDKGVGIAQEDIQYLFKPFVQLDSGLTREYQGTGLGLALVAQMMRLHGGRVELESEVGEGSRFTITLPWLPEQQNTKTKSTSELPRPSRPEEKHTGKVLLVEDTEVISSLMNEYLHYKGYQVFIARNGMEGFLLAKEETPDLILMDIMMPVMDGLEATKLIREVDSLKHTPIVALTALAMPGDRERCIAAGMTDYLSKPIRIQELADMIQKHLISKGRKPNDQ